MHGASVRDDSGDCDPRVVGPVAGGPDHDFDLEAAAVGEVGGASLSGDEAGTEPDACMPESAPVGADDELSTGLQPSAEAGGGVHAHEAQTSEPPEQIPAKQPLRQSRHL